MRWQALWLLSALAIIGAFLLPWGHKEIVDTACEPTWDPSTLQGGRHCSADGWRVEYRPLSAETVHEVWATYPAARPSESNEWAYAYTDPEMPHGDGVTPPLLLGGPGLFVSVGLLVVAQTVHHIMVRPQTLLAARIAWAVHLGVMLTFLAGIAVHSGTWAAEEVRFLLPGWGLLAAGATLLAGIPLLPARERHAMPSLPTLAG